MALTGAIVVGPDAHGRSVAIVDGRVVADAPPARRVSRAPTAQSNPARSAPTPTSTAASRPTACRRPIRRRTASLRFWSGCGGGSTAHSTAKASRAAARDYVARALLAGTTTLIDHHKSPNLIDGSLAILAEVCEDLGVRALLCYGATERNFGRQEARRGLAECRRVAASPLVRGLVGLHASFTVSDETALEAGALARELGTVVHVHIAEDQADVDDARRRGYPGPLERLLALDALPEGSILAHGVRLSRDEVRRAADAGCWFVHNPRSNEGNRVGYASALAAADASPWAGKAGNPTWRRRTRRYGAWRRRTATRMPADGWRWGVRWSRSAWARHRAAGAGRARRSGRAARRRGVAGGGRRQRHGRERRAGDRRR